MPEITLDKAPKDVQDLFNKGLGAFERGNLDYAIDLLLACVEKEPGFLQARKFLRAAEMRKFKQKKKSNFFTHYISMLTGLPEYLKTMAMAKSGKPDEALISAEKLLRNDPLNPKFITFFAQAAGNANLPEAAIQTLEIARDHYPENISVLNWLGAFYQKTGRTSSARECFEKLSEICPSDPDAVKHLKDALALDSMSTDGWAVTAEKGGTYREIIKDTEEAQLLEQEAKAVKSEKDTDALVADALAKVQAEPENINYYRSLARLYVQKKMFNDAIAILNKAIEISRGDPELDAAMTSTRSRQFDYEISQLEEAGNSAGAETKKAEKQQFVFNDLQERVKRYPNDLKLRYDWGIMLLNNDYRNEAIQQFQMSQRSPKHRLKSLYSLAMCFKQKKQYDLAMDQLEKAGSETVTMDDTKKDILYELGEISEIMGNEEKSTEYYKQIYQVDIGYKDIAAKIERAYKTS